MTEPTSEDELADIIASAKGPLAIEGGGTRQMHPEGDRLCLKGISGITLYEPGALTLVAKVGTTLREIEAALDAENQMLAFEPFDLKTLLGSSGETTIGGIVASNASGPARMQLGSCRDFLLGARFVDGRGEIIESGGRVMKNVTGYDLARLMCGAHGTLGVLTEVSFKVLPRPETQATLTLENVDPDAAVPAMSAALTSQFEVTGAYYGQDDPARPAHVRIRVQGPEASVNYRVSKLTDVLADFGEDQTVDTHEASRNIWSAIRDVTFLKDKEFVLRSSMPATKHSQILERGELDAEEHLDWGGGRRWTAASKDDLLAMGAAAEGDDIDSADAAAEMMLSLVRSEIEFVGGHSTVVKASQAVRSAVDVFHPESSTLQALAREMRSNFDPRGILNPGLMG